MITEKDLREAIAECQGIRNPNANTCIKLAAYYTILDNLTKGKEVERIEYPVYSYDAPEEYQSESEFGQLLYEKGQYNVLKVVDELMETLRIMQPKLYEAFMRKLTALE